MFKLFKKLNKFLDNYDKKENENYIIQIKKDMIGEGKLPKNLTILCQFNNNEELKTLSIYKEKLPRKQCKKWHAFNSNN